MEGTWWRRKITSHPDESTILHKWLQMIITWSIFITLSPFVFHNDIDYVNFMPSFICKVGKWMEVSLKMQTIIGHFMIFGQLQQVITCSIFGDFEWFNFKMSFKRSTSFHLFWSRENSMWKAMFRCKTL